MARQSIYWKKAESEKFERECAALLLRLGATCPDPEAWYPWVLETPAGTLRLIVHGIDHFDPSSRHYSADLMARFDDPKAARGLVDCNPYSGKWNHHYFPEPGIEIEHIIVELEHHLRRVLPKVPA